MTKPPYKISTEPPPNYARAREKFGIDFYGHPVGTVFTYGDTIHVAQGYLQHDVLMHELVHVKQQTQFEGGPEAWWEKFFEDEQFRFDQEMAAYRTQYRYVVNTVKSRAVRHEHALFYAQCLERMYSLPGFGVMDFYNLIVAGKK